MFSLECMQITKGQLWYVIVLSAHAFVKLYTIEYHLKSESKLLVFRGEGRGTFYYNNFYVCDLGAYLPLDYTFMGLIIRILRCTKNSYVPSMWLIIQACQWLFRI